MSTWVVSKAHIDVLVDALAAREMLIGDSLDDMGRILWEENVRSFDYCYENRYHDEVVNLPVYTFTKPPTAWSEGALIKIVGCYMYQACECPDWKRTPAFQATDGLLKALKANGAKEDDSAPWGVCSCGGDHQSWEDCPLLEAKA